MRVSKRKAQLKHARDVKRELRIARLEEPSIQTDMLVYDGDDMKLLEEDTLENDGWSWIDSGECEITSTTSTCAVSAYPIRFDLNIKSLPKACWCWCW
jgi:hypothetical protein